jgi:hypothetical protein
VGIGVYSCCSQKESTIHGKLHKGNRQKILIQKNQATKDARSIVARKNPHQIHVFKVHALEDMNKYDKGIILTISLRAQFQWGNSIKQKESTIL